MPSNAQRGAYWKKRSRRFLEAEGYIVVDLEIVRTVWINGRMIPTKKDQLGADLMGVSAHGYIWVQVKGYTLTRPSLAAAKRKFLAYPTPPNTTRCIMLWQLRGRTPEIID